IAEDASSPALVRSCANLATDLALLGALERAWPVYEKGRVAARRFGDANGLHWLAAERPYELYWRGEWEEALAVAESSLRDSEGDYAEHAARSVRAWIRLARGDHGGALEDSAWALDFARRASDHAALCQGLALRGRVLAETGAHGQADAIVDQGLAEAAAPGAVASFWIADLVDALHELGRTDVVSEPAPGSRTSTRWLVAARHASAGAHLAAADEYAAIGARPEEARARLRGSAVLAADGDRAAADHQLELARAFYREVGAEAYLRVAATLVGAT